MRHHNSVLRGLLKHVPWGVFDRLVVEHGADARVRRLTTKSQLVALLYGQFSGAVSLREIETAMASHAGRFYHLGACKASRSTLADANRDRPHEVFSGLLAHMMAQASSRRLRREGEQVVRLIDSTGLHLAGMACEWARFSVSKNVCGAKAHVIYDPDAGCPLYLEITPAKVNDITPAQAMPVEPGASYVFDLGYYSYAWWARLHAAGCRIVTRLKTNTQLRERQERALPEGSGLLYDRSGLLPERLKGTRHHPFQDRLREIGVVLETGRTLRIVTNDLAAPAADIAALYKRRWAIELFFRWVKQTLKIARFLGRSENAVRIQIAVALIAYLLMHLAKQAANIVPSPLAFARLVRANLMHQRNLSQLLDPPKRPNPNPDQLSLQLASA